MLAVQVAGRPRMVLIRRWGVYHAPDLKYNLFLLNKVWYLYYDEKWYQGPFHDGPWRYLPFSKVPDKLKSLPPEYFKDENAPPPPKAPPSKKKSSKKKVPKKSK